VPTRVQIGKFVTALPGMACYVCHPKLAIHRAAAAELAPWLVALAAWAVEPVWLGLT
jgi:hypothetical protein